MPLDIFRHFVPPLCSPDAICTRREVRAQKAARQLSDEARLRAATEKAKSHAPARQARVTGGEPQRPQHRGAAVAGAPAAQERGGKFRWDFDFHGRAAFEASGRELRNGSSSAHLSAAARRPAQSAPKVLLGAPGSNSPGMLVDGTGLGNGLGHGVAV